MDIVEWKKQIKALNDYINSLRVWNDHAESCQAEYDLLLKQRPKE
jgi:hypothetical protein